MSVNLSEIWNLTLKMSKENKENNGEETEEYKVEEIDWVRLSKTSFVNK